MEEINQGKDIEITAGEGDTRAGVRVRGEHGNTQYVNSGKHGKEKKG